MYNAVI